MSVSLRASIGIILTQMVEVPNLNAAENNELSSASTATMKFSLVLLFSKNSLENEEICPADDFIIAESNNQVLSITDDEKLQ